MTNSELPVFYYAQGTSWLFNMFGVTVSMSGQLTHLDFLGIDLVNNPEPPASDGWIKGLDGEFYYWDGTIPNDVFPRLLSPTLWQYKRVPHPSSTFFIGPSIEVGVRWIIDDIKTRPVGTPFALGGYSQGAAVMSRVYNECRQGELADRRHDLRAVVAFGNPMRQQGHTFPGSSGYSGACDIPLDNSSGHGAFPHLSELGIFDPFISRFARLQNTEQFFWDFTMPNEVISGVGDSPEGKQILNFTREGLRILPIFALLEENKKGFARMGEFCKNSFLGGVEQNADKGIKITDPKTGEVKYTPAGGGHIMYPLFPPPNADGSIPTSGDTCYQIAAKYLNDVGATIWDELHPTIPAPTIPAGYQWFSSLPNG